MADKSMSYWHFVGYVGSFEVDDRFVSVHGLWTVKSGGTHDDHEPVELVALILGLQLIPDLVRFKVSTGGINGRPTRMPRL